MADCLIREVRKETPSSEQPKTNLVWLELTGCSGNFISFASVLSRKVIQLPGCPCHPDWFTGTLAHILLYGEQELDSQNRPTMFYAQTIHERCERRGYFEKGIFAQKSGDEGYMLKIGCRGPVTRIDCPIRKWNNHVNWPIGSSTPCIGCAQFGFPDKMKPFISYD